MATTAALDRLWSEIESVRPPEPVFPTAGEDALLVPLPLAAGVRSKTIPRVVWALVLPTAMIALAWEPLVLVALGSLVVVGVWSRVHTGPWRAEYQRRRAALAEAERIQAGVLRHAGEIGPEGFAARQARLGGLRSQYLALAPEEQRALAGFERAAAGRQLQRHLENCGIGGATIPGLGPARKVTLRLHGISSAAQVRPAAIQNLPGFGPALTGAIVAWRDSCRAVFSYDPDDPVTRRERESAREPFRERRRLLETELAAGRDELLRLSRLPGTYRGQVAQDLALATRNVAQAHLDLAVL